MLLTKHDSVTLASDGMITHGDLSGALPFKREATVSTGYSDVSSVNNWRRFWSYVGINYKVFRNTLISEYVGSWGTLNDAQKKTLVRNHVYPASTTTADLDALWTAAKRVKQRFNLIRQFKRCGCVIQPSATANSEKLILAEVNDGSPPTWTLSEIATDAVL